MSQGRSVWGFFAIFAVMSVNYLDTTVTQSTNIAYSFLALLMIYTVLGTLYNRYVLQLRGVDQIPQFSLESMRYHGSEALDWIKDILSGFDFGGHRNGGTPYGGLPSGGLPSGGLRTPNPISHHSQTSGSGHPDDLEENRGLDKSSSGGFIRPQQSKNRASPFQRLETNPVSHQSQVIAQSLSLSTSASPLPSQSQHQTHDLPSQGSRSAAERRGSTKEERDFMLGDDEDAEELADVSTPAPVPRTPTPRVSPPTEPPSNGSTSASSADVASAARGGGVDDIRL